MKNVMKYISIIILFVSCLVLLTGCDDIEYDTSRDKEIKSPSGEYTILLRYDYVSRPFLFKDGEMIFETNKPGFNENVFFEVEWVSENDLILYINSSKEKYKNDRYEVHIDK